LILASFVIVFMSPSIVVGAQPSWLREGVYVVYRFECAYVFEGRELGGSIRIRPIGSGYYKWEVVEVEGRLAVLNVTLKTGGLVRSVLVTINTETMDLLEDSRVWGKAWLWINLAKLPASYPDNTVVRNITVVMN